MAFYLQKYKDFYIKIAFKIQKYVFFKDFCKIKNFKLQNTNKNTKIFFKNTFENKKIKDFQNTKSKIFSKIYFKNAKTQILQRFLQKFASKSR